MIPRRLHLWWHDPVFPESVSVTRNAWAELHPSWDVYLWCREEELTLALATAAANNGSVVAQDRHRHMSHLVRWHLLHDHGGVWVDCDTEPIAPIDDVLTPGTPFCSSLSGPRPTVIGGPPGHPLWTGLIQASSRHTSQPVTSPTLSGAHVLGPLVGQHPDVRVMESGMFFDRHVDGRDVPAPRTGRRVCGHRWDTSSGRLLQRGTG